MNCQHCGEPLPQKKVKGKIVYKQYVREDGSMRCDSCKKEESQED